MTQTHGRRTTYNAGCHCDPCRQAQADYQRQVRAGTTRLLDPAPVRQHAEALLAAGMSWRQLAAAAGIDRSALYRQLTGQRDRIQRRVAAAILALPARRTSRADRTAARLEDTEFLLDAGEHPTRIAARLDMQLPSLQKLLRRHRPDLAARMTTR